MQVLEGEHGRAALDQAGEHRTHGRERGMLQLCRAHPPEVRPARPGRQPHHPRQHRDELTVLAEHGAHGRLEGRAQHGLAALRAGRR